MSNSQKTNKIIGSQFCQSVTINISDNDMTLEFIYLNPISKEQEVVARITLPIEAALKIPELINNLLSEHVQKRKSTIKARS